MKYYYSKSKIFAICIFIISSLLSGYCAYKGLEGATSAIFSTGTLASTGLYANRQYQETKRISLQNQKEKNTLSDCP